MRTRVKLCGLRTPAEVVAAAAAGADALGFNCYPPSRRYLDPALAAEVVAATPPWVTPVALFVDAGPDDIKAVADPLGIRCVQLHGLVTPELCAALDRYQIVMALPAIAGDTLARIAPLRGRLAAVLLDAHVPGEHGGTGQRADWAAAAEIRAALPELPVILAGGLNADNVGDGIAAVQPWAVDVAGGVESAPGVKDAARMTAFVQAVRRADR